jgi:hypothetical protein
MKRLILKLCLLSAFAGVYGYASVTPGGVSGSAGAKCISGTGSVCTCSAGQTCISGDSGCSCS